ncbi:hypothetical protein [Thiomicrorhabdus lithotrophica]|uniref:Uncharacterized protein n=1 Tax=Thiomicrorhabdus lithotrophica TaxID=2949997 RepID=A0ABY8C944_9GAMM|nr:hypothetical protein [Thiomicrorhabdus lithotrophica]WEJ62495.1 hypothetical protein NR989_10830 [Thiomicrorhabdus lithotrophica]
MKEYTLNITLTAYPRGYQVGKHSPEQQRQFLILGIITIVLLDVLTYLNPNSSFVSVYSNNDW